MITSLSSLTERAKRCNCGHKHFDIAIDQIDISNNAFNEAVSYLKKKSFTKVTVITDQTIEHALGDSFHSLLRASEIDANTCIVTPNAQGDVIADEQALIQVLLETNNNTDVLLAVGSGTIHDITRFVSFKMGKPFISIPTAPSVDGFNSMGAPVVIKGMKKTFQMQAPIALFAQLDVLTKAPSKMIAAGFGDILGKYTSLTDWTFSHLVGNEPYCPLAAEVTTEALHYCVNNVENIAQTNEKGIQLLMEALVASGLAMLLIGHSSPASGAEHHLSHCWEMEFIRQNRPQILHGAKVGVTAQLIADLYKHEFYDLLTNEEKLSQLQTEKNSPYFENLLKHKEKIMAAINQIPDASAMKQMIEQLKGDSTPEMLGVTDELVQSSFQEAHLIRDRYTILRFINEHLR